MRGMLFFDSHFFNLGIRNTESATEHDVVIIDAGSRGLVFEPPSKSQVGASKHKLWKWAEEEISAPSTDVRQLWHSQHDLDQVMRKLGAKWAKGLVLTVHATKTAQVDADIIAQCS